MRMDRVAQSLSELVEYCRPRGIVIAVENLPGERLCNNAQELRTLVEHFHPQEVGICFDTGHANLQGDPVATFQLLRDRIVTFHISDNKGLQDDHDLPYVGTLDWTAFMRALQESSYSGVFMYEVGSQKDARQDLSDIRRNFARLLL